jgi:HRDC domain
VLCPNAALEAIAWANPTDADAMKDIVELKGWFVREFGEEIVGVLASHEVHAADDAAAEAEAATKDPSGDATSDGPARRGRRRSGRSRRAARAKKAARQPGRSGS